MALFKKKKNKQKPRTFWGKLWRFTLRAAIICFLSSFIYLIICIWVMPPITITQTGAALSKYGLKRDYVSWEEISPNLKLAAIASEDQLFPEHEGFDWKAMEKSFEQKETKTKKKSNRIRGAGSSTISQQTAKNVFLWQGSGFVGRGMRKVPEFYFTKMIEWIWGKKRILEVYLNVIEMGPGIFGAEAAAQKYFSKKAKDLTRKEAAMIIASLPNPKIYTVKPLSKWVSWRSEKILIQMNNIADDDAIKEMIK